MANFAELVWDQMGEKLYETGVDKTVLFPQKSGVYGEGVAWNGVTAINEKPSGAEQTDLYADNQKYLSLTSIEKYGCTIEAYMYPDAFKPCLGIADLAAGVSVGQQSRSNFGLAFRTIIGNDTDNDQHGYKLHLVYGCVAAPSEQGHATINESPEAGTMSFEVSTTPVNVKNMKATSYVVIDSTKVDADKLKAFEKIIYGSTEANSRLPLPDEVAEFFASAVVAG